MNGNRTIFADTGRVLELLVGPKRICGRGFPRTSLGELTPLAGGEGFTAPPQEALRAPPRQIPGSATPLCDEEQQVRLCWG